MQIRTHEMHRMAEYGVAAHWRYKQNPNATKGSKGNEFEVNFTSASSEMDWLRQLIDWQKDTQDPADFLDSLRFEISGNQVYVFTPKGDVQALPAKATPVDFAFSVHTEVGYRTIGAKVNGRLVPLNTVLETGDTVEIFTSKAQNAGPSRDWMTFVASPRARAKIKAWFSKERREEAIERGKDQIAKAMRKQNLPLQRIMTHDSLMAVAQNHTRVILTVSTQPLVTPTFPPNTWWKTWCPLWVGKLAQKNLYLKRCYLRELLQTKVRLPAPVTLVWLWMVCRKAMFT